MGQKFFTATKPLAPELQSLREMAIYEVVSKASAMRKLLKGQQGLYFIGRRELQAVFGFCDEQIFACLSLLSVNKNVVRVGSVDFWGALALAASGSSEEKLAFCFRLMDTNRDDHLSMNELVILLICITRGLAKLKGLQLLPEDIIDRIVSSAFQSERKKLRADGEISSAVFISFALANENCRSYLAAIGAKVPPVDAAALVVKRTQALKELAQVRFRIEEALYQLEDAHIQQSVANSRGGDLPFLKLFEASSVVSGSDAHSATPSTATNTAGSAYHAPSPPRHKPPLHRPASPGGSSVMSTVSELQEMRIEPEAETLPSSVGSFSGSAEEELLLSVGKEHPVKKFIFEEDSWKNAIYQTKPPAMLEHANEDPSDLCKRICTKQFEAELSKHWRRLPHNEDGLVTLDEASLIALFFQVGIHLPYDLAQDCLQSIVPSQLGRYALPAVLMWIRNHFDLTNHAQRVRTSPWYSWGHALHQRIKQAWRGYEKVMETITMQRRILSGLVRVDEINLAKKLADYRSLCARSPSLVQWQYTFNTAALRKLAKKRRQQLQQQAQGHANPSSREGSPSPPSSPPSHHASQSQQQGGREGEEESQVMKWLTKMRWQWTTNPFTNLSTKRSRENSRIQAVVLDETSGLTELNISDVDNLQANDLLDYYNMINENDYAAAQANPAPPPSAQSSVSSATSASSSLRHPPRPSLALAEGPLVFNNAAWLVLEVKPQAHDSQVYLLRQAIYNAVDALPVHLRADYFSHFYVEVCTTDNKPMAHTRRKSDSSTIPSPSRSSSIAPSASPTHSPSRTSSFHAAVADATKSVAETAALSETTDLPRRHAKVILLALFHTRDHFLQEERRLLLSDLFISRAVSQAVLEVGLMNSWKDLYDESLRFVNYEAKLFGPQEEELGEEDSNPLMFAKQVRQRKKDLEAVMTGMSGLPMDQLRRHCRDLGCTDQGTKREVMDRLQDAMQRKKDLIGHGELSAFGKEILEQVYRDAQQLMVFDLEGSAGSAKRNILSQAMATGPSPLDASPRRGRGSRSSLSKEKPPRGLSLWEFNRLLHRTHTKTFYDRNTYKHFLDEHHLLTDRDKQIVLPALYAYYEKIGQLAEDNRAWAVGSLDRLLAGQFNLQVQFEPQAFQSMRRLLDMPPLSIPRWLQAVASLAMLKEHRVEAEVSSFSDLFDLLPWSVVDGDAMRQAMVNFLREPGRWAVWWNDCMARYALPGHGPLFDLRRYVGDLVASGCLDLNGLQGMTEGDITRRESLAGESLASTLATEPTRRLEELGVVQETDEADEADAGESATLHTAEDEASPAGAGSGKLSIHLVDGVSIFCFEEILTSQYLRRVQTSLDGVYGDLLVQKGYSRDEEGSHVPAAESEVDTVAVVGTETAVETQRQTTPAKIEVPAAPPGGGTEDDEAAAARAAAAAAAEALAREEEAMLRGQALPSINIPLFTALARDCLPPFHNEQQPDGLASNLQALKQQVMDDLVFLHSVRGLEGLSISLQESTAIEERKAYLESLLQKIVSCMEENDKFLPVHQLVCYDALRCLGLGLAGIGWGTKDCCLRGVLTGFDVFPFLPAVLGEDTHLHRLQEEKQRRFDLRRKAALAAVERERLRRMLTEADLERIRQEKLRQERLANEEHDRQIFYEAKQRLYESREERKMMSELGQIVKLFDELVKRKDSRLPEGFDTLIAKNNLACVLVEIYGCDHPLCEPAQYYLQEAVEKFPDAVEDLDGTGEASSTLPAASVSEEDGLEEGEAQPSVTLSHASIKALVVLNYLDVLYRTQSFASLRQAMRHKEFLVRCIQALTRKQREKLVAGAVPAFRGVDVFHTTATHAALLYAVIQEVAFATSDMSLLQLLSSSHAEQAALEAASVKTGSQSAGEDGKQDEDSLSLASSSQATKTSAQLRKEKRQKYQEQRNKDNKLRQDLSRQRKLLYELIHTDKISEIFAAQANVAASNASPTWGKDMEQTNALEQDQAVFAEVANAMASQSLERSTTRASVFVPPSP